MTTTRRTLTLSLLLTLAAGGRALAAPAASKVTSVVVYADRAQVTRSKTFNCAAGVVEFSDLPSTLERRTLRPTLHGGGKVVGVTWREEATGPRPAAKALLKQIKALDEQLADENDARSATWAVDRKLRSFRSHMQRTWGLQAAFARVPVRTWDAALDLLRKEALAAVAKRRAAQVRSRKLRRKRRRLRRELRRIRRKQRRTTLRALAHVKCAGTRRMSLSYVLRGATWRVSYELRAHRRGRRAKLTAYALVQQATGEDWKNVRLAVSTANLLRRNVPPRIRKMQVTTHKPRTTKKVLARRFVVRRHLRTARRHRRGPRRAAANRALALQLPAAGRVTIPSDGREVVVPLASKTVRSKLSYETVPKLYPYVYQQVKLTNPFSFPMLPGRVAVYRGNTLIGPAPLQQRAPGEPFAFSLGVQNQLQVRRYIKAEKRHPAGTLSSKQRLEHHYKIEVGNWTRRRQRVRVLENIPVARVSEIKVELDSKTTKPTSWDKRDGILSWTLVVPPRSKRTITVAFTVKLPKNYRVSGY